MASVDLRERIKKMAVEHFKLAYPPGMGLREYIEGIFLIPWYTGNNYGILTFDLDGRVVPSDFRS
jgi:hypothetical protein